VRAALAAATDATQLNTLTGVQSVVSTAVNAYSTASTKIAAYAEDDGAAAQLNSTLTPVLGDYTAMGLSNIGGTGQITVAMLNSALADPDITGVKADEYSELKAIADAYQVIYNNANATDSTTAAAVSNATQAQYEAIAGSNPSHFKDVGPEAPVVRFADLGESSLRVEVMAWLKAAVPYLGSRVATELPTDNTTWAASGFTTISAAGGTTIMAPMTMRTDAISAASMAAATMAAITPPR
jgi:hypothetical protein